MLVKLIDKEIYTNKHGEHKVIFMWSDKINDASYYIGLEQSNKHNFSKNGGAFKKVKYSLASSEERQWLQACIKEDKFIPFNEVIIENVYECW